MDELINIQQKDGKKVVSARELHKKLEATERFSNWFKRYVVEKGFIQNEHYKLEQIYNEKAKQVLIDYILSLEVALHICKMSKQNKGRELEAYFTNQITGHKVIYKELQRKELQFEQLLTEFLNGWNLQLLTQVSVCENKYRIDFLINGYIAVEYDEEHHKYQRQADKLREKEINDWVKQYYNDDTYNIIFIRVNEGEEIKALHNIVSQLIAYGDLSDWNGKCVSYRSEFGN